MIVLDLKQNTPEWDEFRKNSIGASHAAAIMDKSPWKTRQDVYEEIVDGKKLFITDAMKKGIDLEEIALEWCMDELECSLENRVVTNLETPYAHASLDGISQDRTVTVEIKCVGRKTHKIAKVGNIPDQYQWQMTHQLMITRLPFMYYCSYLAEGDQQDVVMIRFDRDLQREKEYKKALEAFWFDHVSKKIPPNPKIVTVLVPGETERALRLEANLKTRAMIKRDIAQLEEVLEAIEKDIIEDCQGESVEVGEHKAVKTIYRGTVDYPSIPELKDVDLDKYRKPSRVQWRFS